MQELIKQIEAELYDLPYAVSCWGDVIRITQYERLYENPHLFQIVEKKRYEVRNLEEWNSIREDLAPTSGMLEAYGIYNKYPDDASFRALSEKFSKALAYRGVSVEAKQEQCFYANDSSEPHTLPIAKHCPECNRPFCQKCVDDVFLDVVNTSFGPVTLKDPICADCHYRKHGS